MKLSLHEINLLIQFFILVVFLTSLVFKWKKNYFIHGTLMLIAVISYLTSFVWYVSSMPSMYTATEIMDAFFGNYLTMSVFAIHIILGLSSGLLAILIVGFFWALQHIFLPFLPDVRYLVWRFLQFLGIGMLMPWLFSRFRRLRPLIITHWLMDISSLFFTIKF